MDGWMNEQRWRAWLDEGLPPMKKPFRTSLTLAEKGHVYFKDVSYE